MLEFSKLNIFKKIIVVVLPSSANYPKSDPISVGSFIKNSIRKSMVEYVLNLLTVLCS
jgi:hypothetical protein